MEELVTDGATRMNGAVAAKTCRVPVTGADGFIGSVDERDLKHVA